MATPLLYNDKELLLQIANGDEKAFRIFFHLYKTSFYATIYKMTRSELIAEEIVQEIFIRIWEKRELLTGIDNPSAYFFKAVYRKVYQYYKDLALQHKLLNAVSERQPTSNAADELLLVHESEKVIQEAVNMLSPQQKLIFKLSKQEGLSRQEIADQLHISPNTVRNHMVLALKTIRSYLDKSALTGFYVFWLFKDKF